MATAGQRRVMICVDGSEEAEHAFQWYLKNTKQPNDYVYGVTCVEYNFGGMSFGPLADPEAVSKQFGEQFKIVEKLTADYTAKLRAAGVKGQFDHISGKKPGPGLCEFADQVKADLILMGTRGLGAFKKFMLGSVSNFVLQNASCPVTVIPFSRGEKSEKKA